MYGWGQEEANRLEAAMKDHSCKPCKIDYAIFIAQAEKLAKGGNTSSLLLIINANYASIIV